MPRVRPHFFRPEASVRESRYLYALPVSATIIIVSLPAILAKVMFEGWLQVLVATSALVLGILLRLSPLSILIVGLSFDFAITWPIVATLNLAIFAIPLLAVQTFRKLGQESAQTRSVISGIAIWFGAFLASVILSVALNEVELSAVYLSLGKITIAFIVLLLVALQLGTGRNFISTLNSVIYAWLWVAAISLVSGFLGLALWDLAGIENNLQHWGQGRVRSGFQNPNNFGHFQLIALGLAIFAVNFRSPGLLIVPIFGATLGVLLSGSQTALISLALIVALGLAFSTPKLRTTISICLGTFSGFAAYFAYRMAVQYFTSGSTFLPIEDSKSSTSATIQSTISDFAYTANTGVSGDLRWEIWKEALEFFRENPIVGIGLGQFQITSNIRLEVHNSHLQILAEGGAIMWVTLFGPILFATIISFKRKFSPKLIPLIAGLGVFSLGSTQLHSLATWASIAVFFSVLAKETLKERNGYEIVREWSAQLRKKASLKRNDETSLRTKLKED